MTADDASHTFELAILPHIETPIDSVESAQATIDPTEFNLHRITIEELKGNANIVNDPKLVCRFNGKYLTWENASPVLASLGIYQDAIASVPLSTQDDPSTASNAGTPAAPSTKAPATSSAQPPSRRWSWWSSGAKTKPPASSAPVDASSPGRESRPEHQGAASAAASPGRASRAASPEPFQGSVRDHSVRASSPEPEPEPVSEYDQDEVQSDIEKKEDGKHYAKTLRLTSDQLKQLGLKKGRNDVSFSVMSSYSYNVVKCTSRIFLWDQDYKCVISDIDGTITK